MRKSPVAMREHTRSAVQVHWKNPGEGDSAKSEVQELFPRSASVWSEGCLFDSSFLHIYLDGIFALIVVSYLAIIFIL